MERRCTNPHERTIFECDGRTGRVKQCIVGKTSKQPFYVVCWGTSTKEEMVDEVTLQTYSKREEPAAEAAAANPTKEETAAGAAADLVKRSAGNVVGWGDDRPRPKPSGGQYPVEGGPERPWRDPVATAGIMPDRDTEPWRFRTVAGKERWRYKKQGPQAGGDWSPPGPQTAQNYWLARKRDARLARRVEEDERDPRGAPGREARRQEMRIVQDASCAKKKSTYREARS